MIVSLVEMRHVTMEGVVGRPANTCHPNPGVRSHPTVYRIEAYPASRECAQALQDIGPIVAGDNPHN